MEVASAISNLRQKPDPDAIRARVAESYGDDFAAQVMAAQGFANGGIASIVPKFAGGSLGGVLIDSILFLKKSGGPWIEKTLDALKRGEIDAEDARSLDLPEDLIQGSVGLKGGIDDMGGVVSPRNVRRAGDDIPEFEDDVIRSAEESLGAGGRSPFDNIPDVQDDVMRSADDLIPPDIPMQDPGIPLDSSGNVIPMASSSERAAVAAGGTRAARGGIEALAKPPLTTKQKAALTAGTGVGVAGIALTAANLLGDDEEVVDQAAIDAQAAAAAQATIDAQAAAEASITEPPPTPPEPSFLSKAGDVVGGLLADKKLRAGLIRASKPTEGFVPRSFAADVYEGGRDYEIEQAKLKNYEQAGKTAMEKNYELIKSINPGIKDEEALSLLLKSSDGKEAFRASLFTAAYKNPLLVDANTGELKPGTVEQIEDTVNSAYGGEKKADPSTSGVGSQTRVTLPGASAT